ncbi:F-box/kelch-repeat protein [Actinidia chinensis var. chinensis]|uniref:F-box/kelch-repeat protein n=1 Tax=Actinidia chinensis var. chinensis TaxID=1590841 RepID=A0A2R6QFP9_ACTCC|nr:F-box/kelch-repeat protein [Actinidia chinensis var. chinensis]
MDLIPGLPNEVALECLIRVPYNELSVAASVCRGWKAEIEMPVFRRHRKSSGLARPIRVLAQARVDPNQNSRVAKSLARAVYRLTLCDPETGHWSELPVMPGFPDGLPMFCHVLGVRSEVVVMGGCDPLTWQVLNSVMIYNFVSGMWRRGADIPGGNRLFFGCASDSDRMVYVAGGHDNEKNALRSAMMYDVMKDEWVSLPDMAKDRDECKGVFHRGKFHVISGYPTEAQGRFAKDAEEFDVITWKWAQYDFLETAMCPRTCVDGGEGMLYMCHNGSVMAREGATWQVIGGLPADVANAAYVAAWQGKLLVIGCAQFGEPHRAYLMDLKSSTWTKIESPEEYSGYVQSGGCLEI